MIYREVPTVTHLCIDTPLEAYQYMEGLGFSRGDIEEMGQLLCCDLLDDKEFAYGSVCSELENLHAVVKEFTQYMADIEVTEDNARLLANIETELVPVRFVLKRLERDLRFDLR